MSLVDKPLRVGLIGCGLMGRTRSAALGRDVLIGATDPNLGLATALVEEHGGVAADSVSALLAMRPDAVIVSTPHALLPAITCQALDAGAHVLVEKPAGICATDIDDIEKSAAAAGKIVKIGFNHRFHPGTARAIAEATSGRFGEVMFFRARYGHGGRVGYEQEWRFQREISGGGEMVDQGMHLLDLSYAIMGELPLHSALLRNQFWGGEVEDNAALILGAPDDRSGPWAQLHVTWTEWKNLFALEIMCQHGKIQVDGLARSYGPQVLHLYTMKPEMGPPDVERIEFPAADTSWAAEWDEFRTAAIRPPGSVPLHGDLASARYAWQQVESAFASTGNAPFAGRPR